MAIHFLPTIKVRKLNEQYDLSFINSTKYDLRIKLSHGNQDFKINEDEFMLSLATEKLITAAYLLQHSTVDMAIKVTIPDQDISVEYVYVIDLT